MPVSFERHHLELPAVTLGELAVHPEQLGRKQRRFVAARAGADLEHDVPFVVRIFRDEEDLQIGDERFAAGDQAFELFLRQLAHVRIGAGGELFGLGDVARDGLVLAEALDGRFDFRERLRVLPVDGRIALDLGRADEPEQLLVLLFNGGQLINHVHVGLRPTPRLGPASTPASARLAVARRAKAALAGAPCPAPLPRKARTCAPSYHPPDTGGRNAISSPSPTAQSMRA